MERQLLNGFLAIAAVCADSGLLAFNRLILSSKVPISLSSLTMLTILDRWHLQVSAYYHTSILRGHDRLTLIIQISISSNNNFDTKPHFFHCIHLDRTPCNCPSELSDLLPGPERINHLA